MAIVYEEEKKYPIPRSLRAVLEVVQRGGPAWITFGASLALCLVGMLAINIAEETRTPGAWFTPSAARHLVFACGGVVVGLAVALPDYRKIAPFAIVLYLLALVPLVFLILPGVPASIVRARGGAKAWIDLGPIDVQPSEFVKVACVLLLASYLRYKRNHRTIPGLVRPALITGVPMALIMLQPDLGTAVLFIPALFFVLIAAGAKLKHLVLAIVLATLAAPAVYPILKPHQKQRIVGLFMQVTGDESENLAINMQPVTAQRLIGAGRFFGRSAEEARSLHHFNSLPERQNDMVFAPVVTRFGLLGGLFVLLLCLAWCVGALATAASAGDPFGRLICAGAAGFFIAQVIINIGMNLGLLPIVGITLPYVSLGGSSMIAQWVMAGLVLGVGFRRGGYEVSYRIDEDE